MMKRMMLIGPSQCGKTSLTQWMRGETLRYQKTQAIVWTPATIDTPASIWKTADFIVRYWLAHVRQML